MIHVSKCTRASAEKMGRKGVFFLFVEGGGAEREFVDGRGCRRQRRRRLLSFSLSLSLFPGRKKIMSTPCFRLSHCFLNSTWRLELNAALVFEGNKKKGGIIERVVVEREAAKVARRRRRRARSSPSPVNSSHAIATPPTQINSSECAEHDDVGKEARNRVE